MNMDILRTDGMRVLAEVLLARIDPAASVGVGSNPHWLAFWSRYESEVEAGGLCCALPAPEESDPAWRDFDAALRRLASPAGPDLVRTLLRATPEDHVRTARARLPLPFVLEDTEAGAWLYTQRHFLSEIRLARSLSALALDDASFDLGSGAPTAATLDRLSEEQRRAVDLVLTHRLTIVSGKPGSGKTTVVVQALSALFERNPKLVVLQMAPTGKASTRLDEALDSALAATAPEECARMRAARAEGRILTRTVDKWLIDLDRTPGTAGRPKTFDADVVVVDEASMLSIDLAMRLFEAIDPKRTRVVVLGDKHQLAAVGPGRVFADLCETQGSVLDGHVALFRMSHRFPDSSRVGRMADLLLEPSSPGRDEALLGILEDLRLSAPLSAPTVRGVPAATAGSVSVSVQAWLLERFVPVVEALLGFREALRQGAQAGRSEAVRLCARIRSLRVLCASRGGRNGLEAVNAFLEAWMRSELELPTADGPHFPGRLVIVRENRPELGLANGDVGVVLEAGADHRRVFVPETFGMHDGDRLEDCLDVRELPRCDAAYALTVHQSQGSEYAQVLLILPEHAESGLSTKELLYTGATRVRFSREEIAQECDRLKIVSGKEVWRESTTACVERSGRLLQRLRAFCDADRREDAGLPAA